MDPKRYIPILYLVVVLVVFQVAVTLAGSTYYLIQLTMSAYYALVIIGLCMLMGYAGQISIGHAAFFAMGGYTSAVLTTFNLIPHESSALVRFLVHAGLTVSRQDPYGAAVVHLSPWIAFLLALLITALVAFIMGIPILKLKGHYLAMATLGLGTIIYRVLLGSRIFGEADGISDVPPFTLIGDIAITGDGSVRVLNYYLAWSLLIIGMLILINLINSRVGRALRSIHGSEEAANSMGINPGRYKLFVFVLSAVFAAAGGVFMTHYNGGIGPSESGVIKSVRYLAIVAVGGMANLWGVLSMGIVLNYLSLRGYFGSYDDAVFGLILILIMLFAPDGIIRRQVVRGIREWIVTRNNAGENAGGDA